MIEAPVGLSTLVIANARRYATGKSLETDGPNDGPEIREWLAERGITTPAPYCAAGACAQIHEAARTMGLVLQLRYSAGALRMLDLNPDLVLAEPEIGCLVIWDHGQGKGHLGIVTGVTRVAGELAAIQVISFNTNAEGSRDADQCVERGFPFPQARRLAGYIRIA